MPSPFPGMDPYLESPNYFGDVHNSMISEIRRLLNARLRPNYIAHSESRIYLEDEDKPVPRVPDVRIEHSLNRKKRMPDSEGGLMIEEPIILPTVRPDPIEEAYLTIKHRESKALVAVLEVLSPSNKTLGSEGRKSFMAKRREVLSSNVHWIEIDLLRKGARFGPPNPSGTDYRSVVIRGDDDDETRLWPVSLREKLPVIGIPLRGRDPDVPLDLSAAFNAVYDDGSYDLAIDYRKPPDPPLDPDDAKWANKLLRSKGLR